MYFDSNQKISSNFSITDYYLSVFIPPIGPFSVLAGTCMIEL